MNQGSNFNEAGQQTCMVLKTNATLSIAEFWASIEGVGVAEVMPRPGEIVSRLEKTSFFKAMAIRGPFHRIDCRCSPAYITGQRQLSIKLARQEAFARAYHYIKQY